MPTHNHGVHDKSLINDSGDDGEVSDVVVLREVFNLNFVPAHVRPKMHAIMTLTNNATDDDLLSAIRDTRCTALALLPSGACGRA